MTSSQSSDSSRSSSRSAGVTQGVLPLVGAARGNGRGWPGAIGGAGRSSCWCVVAFGCLAYSFVTNDFSVAQRRDQLQLAACL